MKKIWIILLMGILLAGCSGTPEPPDVEKDSWGELGSTFVEHLAADEYDEAFAMFDDTMKEALPLEDLTLTWTAVQDQTGEYIQEVDYNRETEDPYEIVILTGEFAQGYADIRIVFNADEEISGLFFLPSTYTP